jgi:hypothetical protein
MPKVRVVLMLTMFVVCVVMGGTRPVAAGQIDGGYRVLKPIESGGLTLFPVVRTNGRSGPDDPFLTLDEGLKSGEVEVTEAGRLRTLVRSRGGAMPGYGGDQVNTLVLVNHSKRPLLLLAGEIVTGGKQDRVIAKDRIVPVDADPIDLSVFCIEHGRWTETSAKFGVTAKSPAASFMVQPTVRQQAMVAKDQQQVWNSVSGAISNMAAVAGPVGGTANATVAVDGEAGMSMNAVHGGNLTVLGTTSYAKAMQLGSVSAKVDEAGAESAQTREHVLMMLKQEHAVGVVVAVRGEVIWADMFANTDLLARYWPKLVRSYAAEVLSGAGQHEAATMEEAQRFLDAPMRGLEVSEGEVGVYRYREVKVGGTDQFALESLLPGLGYDVHISRLKLKNAGERSHPSLY